MRKYHYSGWGMAGIFVALVGCNNDSSSSSINRRVVLSAAEVSSNAMYDPTIDEIVTVTDAFSVEARIDETTDSILVTLSGETRNLVNTIDNSDIDDRQGDDLTAGDGSSSSGTAELTFVLQNDIPEGSPFGVNSVRWTRVPGFSSLYSRNRARRFALRLPDGTTDLSAIRLSREDDRDTSDRVENTNYVEYHGLAYIGPRPRRTRAEPNPVPPEIVRVEIVLLPNYDDGVNDNDQGPTDTTPAQANYNALEGENIGLGIQFDPAQQTSTIPRGQITYNGLYLGHNRLHFTTPDVDYDLDGEQGIFPEISASQVITARELNTPRMTLNVDVSTSRNIVSFTIDNVALSVDQTLNEEAIRVSGQGSMDISGRGTTSTEDGRVVMNGQIRDLDNVRLSLDFTTSDGTNTVRNFQLSPGTLIIRADTTGPGNRLITIRNEIFGRFFDQEDTIAAVVAGSINLRTTGSYDFDGVEVPGDNDDFGIEHEMLGVFIAER